MVEKEIVMNWHYGQPIVNKQYLCCVKGYDSPLVLDWCDGDWGDWNDDGSGDWIPFDNDLVVCYIGFDEIPMPENW
jgi:hypothetical protein